MTKVYIKKDSSENIIEINSSTFIDGFGEWYQIDEGSGYKYVRAQNEYFPAPLHDDRGIPRYAYVPDGNPKWRERTQEEMDADYVPPPEPPKSNAELQTESELLRAQVKALSDRGEFIEDCIAEMAMQVYQ